MQAVRSAIVEHPDVQIQRAAVVAAEAAVQQRQGAFDVFLTSTVGHDHSYEGTLQQEQDDYEYPANIPTERTKWRVGAAKQFDFGMQLQTYAEVERTEQVDVSQSNGRARVALVATQALMRGRGADTGAAASEEIAKLGVETASSRLRHTTSRRAMAVMQTYWSYVAAHRRLAILSASEARAETLVGEVEMLIEKDERPAGEAVHFKALLADRQSARAAAEVDVVRTRQALGLSMGLVQEAIQGLGAPADPLPTPLDDWRVEDAGGSSLAEQGVSVRADLAAARFRIKAAELFVHAARRDTELDLSLRLSLGYSGLEEGKGAETLVTPLAGQVGGPDVGVALNLAWPIQNRALLGRLSREQALLDRARLAVQDMARTIRAEIASELKSLELEIRVYQAAKASVSLHEQTVLNQRRRLRSELTTAIDVLITEERLTGAMMSALSSEVRYAQAVTRLRFATASLLPQDGGADDLDGERLVRPPGAGGG